MREAYIPPGRQGRQPEVRVKTSTVAALGEPNVDYAKLDSLFREELEVPYDTIPQINVVGDTRWGIAGLHVPYTRSIYINAAKCVSQGQERLDAEVLRQAYYLGESVNSPIITGFYLAGYPSGIGVGKLIANNEINFIDGLIPDSLRTVEASLHLVAPLITTAAGVFLYNRLLDLRRMQAKDFANDEEMHDQYREIIVFPGNANPQASNTA